MKRIAVLSSLSPLETYEKLDLDTSNIEYKDQVSLIRAPGIMLYIVHASPLGRRLAFPLLDFVDSVTILYDKNNAVSTLRARQWRSPTKKIPVCYNIKLYNH